MRVSPLLFLLIGWLWLAAPVRGAAPPPDSTRAIAPARRADPLRAPDPGRYEALRTRGDLYYHPPNYQPRLTWWERFWRWLWDGLDRVFDSPAVGRTSTVLWYAFLVGMLAWVVLRVLGFEISGLWARAPRTAPAYDVEVAESPFTDDLTGRLAEAEARGDYRLAVRLGYLLVLRALADRDLIRWLPDKTNQQYLRELPAGPLRDQLAPLTRQFEVAWYGETLPTAAAYAATRETRAALLRALQRHAAPAPTAA